MKTIILATAALVLATAAPVSAADIPAGCWAATSNIVNAAPYSCPVNEKKHELREDGKLDEKSAS